MDFNDVVTHKIGPWRVESGSMIHKETNRMLDEDIAILVSIDGYDGLGTLHKIGKSEQMNNLLIQKTNRLRELGMDDFADEFMVLKFNVKYEEFGFAPDGYNLNIDETCTVINWLFSCSGQKLKEFFESDMDTIKSKIEMLQRIGY